MSFDETYKTYYSHGLESIYALETVDPRSIRRLETVQKEAPPRIRRCERVITPQFEFDFGPSYRNWIEPLLLDEPIQVLRLSRSAERPLLEQRREKLRDLISCDWRQVRIGQGHLDEIAQKLAAYTAGKELERAPLIDFGAWIRALCPSKKYALVLESYGLDSLLVGDKRELTALTDSLHQEWRLEALTHLKARRVEVRARLDELVAVFVRPWVAARKGLATGDEIIERLQKRAYEPQLVEPTLKFMEEVLDLNLGLEEVDKQVYAAEKWHGQAFKEVVTCARSYFRRGDNRYLFAHLISLIEREMARVWQGYEEEFVAKVLRLSSQFSVCRREISLAFDGLTLYREKYVEADQTHCRHRGSWADRL